MSENRRTGLLCNRYRGVKRNHITTASGYPEAMSTGITSSPALDYRDEYNTHGDKRDPHCVVDVQLLPQQ